jgi:hypothetical protein
MRGMELLDWFFKRVSTDARISIGHLGLYCALFQLWHDQGMKDEVHIYAREVMEKAKISSTATYRKLISDLHDFGYLIYLPSFYKRVKSRIILADVILMN